MGPEVKKTGRQKLLQHKIPQHFHRLFFVLKMDQNTEFCFLYHPLMSLNKKKILNIFLVNFICEKYLFWKNSLFLGPFFGGGDYSGGGQFLELFSSHFERLLLKLQTLQVSEGVQVQKYFLKRPRSQKNLMSSGRGRWYRFGCALTFASEAKFEIEAKISFRLEVKKKPDFTWFTSM
jgi:hypothetical protein